MPVTASGEWPDDPAERADLEQQRDSVFGDRRQELLFVGLDLLADKLRESLRHCLLTPAEPPWARMPGGGCATRSRAGSSTS